MSIKIYIHYIFLFKCLEAMSKMGDTATTFAPGEQVPYQGYDMFFEFHSREGNTIKLRCKLCPLTHYLSGNKSTAANFKKHIEVRF